MHTLMQDLRYAVRSLLKNPGFTLVVTLILAVGIGINTTIFTAVNAVLVRPLPYQDPAQLFDLGTHWERSDDFAVNSYDDIRDIREKVAAFAAVGAHQNSSYNLSDGDADPERVEGAMISAGLFPLLGVTPRLGRTFTAEEEVAGGPAAALLGDGLWRRRFNADPSIVGRAVTINGEPHTIVGVMPPRFAFPDGQQLWTPLKPLSWFSRGNHHLNAVVRLKPGVTPAQAQLELATLMTELERQFPESNTNKSAVIVPLHSEERGEIGVSLYAMMGAVAFVLLIACANVANLLLVRGASRQREIAVRTALGAGRGRIVRQLLTESLLLALAGAALGTMLAAWGTGLIDAIIPADRPWFIALTFDWRVAAFTAALAMLSGVLFGLAPALMVSRGSLTESLKEGGQGGGTSVRRQRLRSSLVVAEIALSVVLVAGAALMVRSFVALRSADTGFNRSNLLTAAVVTSGPGYDEEARRGVFVEGVLRRLEGAPGVASAGAIVNLPLGGSLSITAVEPEGRPAVLGEEITIEARAGAGDFLTAFGVAMVKGRGFDAAEQADTSRHAVVINETAARVLFPDEEPLGKRFRYARDSTAAWWEVVGVVRDVVTREVTREPAAQMWVTYHDWASRGITFVVRTTGEPQSLVAAVRQAIAAQDGSLPVYNVHTMDYVVERSFWERKLFGQLFGTFGLLALALAAVGLYSVIAWSVAQRTREIGVRMALGARLSDVTGMVVAGGMKLTGIGIAIGAIAALLVTGFLRTMLYGVQPRDPLVLAGTALLLGVVALVATVIPARRAARVDPMIALRND